MESDQEDRIRTSREIKEKGGVHINCAGSGRDLDVSVCCHRSGSRVGDNEHAA